MNNPGHCEKNFYGAPCGSSCAACGGLGHNDHEEGKGSIKPAVARIIVSAALLIILHFIPATGLLRFALFLIPYLIAGYDVLREAAEGILHGDVFDENFLMAVATIGALALGDYAEAVSVMVFYKTGMLFEDYAVGRSRRSIEELMDIRPDYANLERNGEVVRANPETVPIGAVIVVRPGEKIPIDGVVLDGNGSLDTSALTGESLPRDIGPGEDVISGCLSLSGMLRIRTTRAFGESTVSKILELVQSESGKKSRSENFISRFARVYTPVVCYSALALAVLPPAVRSLFLGLAPMWGEWVPRALTFLVISCPCALVISVPLSFFGGIGGASRRGILIKGSGFIEALANTGTVVFDKTGTLTKGVFSVAEISPAEGFCEAGILELAALTESWSTHPISRSIRTAYGKKPDTGRVSGVKELPGLGITALVDGRSAAAGNARLMESLGITCADPEESGTVVHMASDGRYAGYIRISDAPKPNSREAVAALRKAGIRKIVMLTGDAKKAAAAVAAELGVDEVQSGLLPRGKVGAVEKLLAEKAGRDTLAFVGDGINDAPVLARADIGIAMGALGSDAAIEAADVVLMDDDPGKVALAISISRKSIGIVRQNIAFALGIKGVCLVLGALGAVGMWLAVFADVGVMVIAVLNAMRTLNTRKL
ncbi:MAG: cadmium-translocating P-type ATPase [Clostridia bacterium]|nr:cadmium-translocating P-type ATPase [Clostridia bacterium]